MNDAGVCTTKLAPRDTPTTKYEKREFTQWKDAELLAFILHGRITQPLLKRAEAILTVSPRMAAGMVRDSAAMLPMPTMTETMRADEARGLAMLELGKRVYGERGVNLHRAEDITLYLEDIRLAKREHFVAFDLNSRHQLIQRRLVSIGSLGASIVHPREVFTGAVQVSAAGIIVAHNHPSGDPEPSPEDISVTRRLRDAGELMGVELLDHIVVAERGHVSLRVRGCL